VHSWGRLAEIESLALTSLDAVFQGFAADKLQRYEGLAFVMADFEDLYDVSVLQVGGKASVADEALLKVGIDLVAGVQDLDGNLAIEARIKGSINRGRSADAEPDADLVAADPRGQGGGGDGWLLGAGAIRKSLINERTQVKKLVHGLQTRLQVGRQVWVGLHYVVGIEGLAGSVLMEEFIEDALDLKFPAVFRWRLRSEG
jgi:hypothetical protein